MKRVYVKFPKTGLGNMMLVWARGLVFARLNNIDYVTTSWWGLRWGALLRQEQRNRLYWGYFKETSWTKRISLFFSLLLSKKIFEPTVNKIETRNSINTVYVFNKVITDNDLFGAIRNHKEIIANELDAILTPKMKAMIRGHATPVIGVHIRRGDFKMGNPITPLSFLIEGIKLVRETASSNLPVTVFTDASEDEITDILQLPNVSLAASKPDILDIILLSKSKYSFYLRAVVLAIGEHFYQRL